jgi:hypothetical protein
MIVKEAVYKKKKITKFECTLISDVVYGCDECKAEIIEYPNEDNRLEITIYNNNDTNNNLHFCSWGCVLKYIPKLKSDYFATLPYIHFSTNKRNYNELVKILKGKK